MASGHGNPGGVPLHAGFFGGLMNDDLIRADARPAPGIDLEPFTSPERGDSLATLEGGHEVAKVTCEARDDYGALCKNYNFRAEYLIEGYLSAVGLKETDPIAFLSCLPVDENMRKRAQ